MSRLDAYLDRIGYSAPVRVDRQTLFGLHRAHLLAIPYENLDIHLGRALTLDVDAIFDKIVTRRRGGWCYEMNGLFAWALREIGFDVSLLAGTVGRRASGPTAEGNHLLMSVRLDQPYLADVGFGNGFLDPLPLAAGRYVQTDFLKPFELRQADGRWELVGDGVGGGGFDFTLEPAVMTRFAAQCHHLQTSPESGFVRVAVCHRFRPDGIYSLRGAVLQQTNALGTASTTLDHAARYRQALEDLFGLHLPEVDPLWQQVWSAHQNWTQSLPKQT